MLRISLPENCFMIIDRGAKRPVYFEVPEWFDGKKFEAWKESNKRKIAELLSCDAESIPNINPATKPPEEIFNGYFVVISSFFGEFKVYIEVEQCQNLMDLQRRIYLAEQKIIAISQKTGVKIQDDSLEISFFKS